MLSVTGEGKGARSESPGFPWMAWLAVTEFQENDRSNLLLSALSVPNTDHLMRLVLLSYQRQSGE